MWRSTKKDYKKLGFYSSKVDRFEMKNINRRFEELLKMCCVCRRLTRTTNNNPA